jgi:predicted Zn-dependent peptidase
LTCRQGLDNPGFDYYDKYLADIKKVASREALEAARKLLPEADSILVAVGKAAEIGPLLAIHFTWQKKKIWDPGF